MAYGSYQVLARKWRPQRFEDIVGQPAVVRTLANALRAGRVAHAYCFSGIRGVGKTTAARLLAKGLNCSQSERPTAEPCGQCESCTEIESSRSLDVIELDAASSRGIDAMKELNEVARYAPSRDRHRVFILDEAHMLTPEASNALLKTLEEPPRWLVFILATTESSKILPTVLSRCQHYEFGRISQREIGAQLGHIATAEGVSLSADALALLAAAADGSLRDGQSLLDKLIAFAGETIDEQTVVDLLGLVDRELAYRTVDLVAAEDVAGVLGFVNQMVERGVDLHQFAVDLLGHFRNLLIVRTVSEPGAILHLPGGDLDRLRAQAKAFEIDDLDRAFSLLATSEYRIKTAEQPRYHLEVLLARLARMPRLEPIGRLLEALEPGGGSGPVSNGGRSRSTPARQPGPPATPPRTTMPATQPTKSPPTPPAAPAAIPAPEPRTPAPAMRPSEPDVARPAPPAEPRATQPQPPTAPAVVASFLPEPVAGSQLLARIQEQVDARNPLIAPLLGRSCGLTMAGERLVVQFPGSAELFAKRLQDPKMLQLLSEAAETVLGRKAIVRVDVLADVKGAPVSPRQDKPLAAVPAAVSVPAPAQPAAPAGSSPAVAEAPPGDDPRARAEAHPMVQEFVKVLRGQVTSVEEA